MSAGKTRVRAKRVGPRSLEGSVEARRHAAVILEVLAGTHKPAEACEALGISVMRYYVLETRALQGMLAALEPRPRGKRATAAREIEVLRRERQRLERDLGRTQSLLRATQRAAGLVAPPSVTKASKLAATRGGTGKRPRAVKARATRAVEALRSGTSVEAAEATTMTAVEVPS